MYGVEGFRRVRWTQSLKNVSPPSRKCLARSGALRDSETARHRNWRERLHVCRDAKTGSMVGFVLARGCAKLYGVTSLSLVVGPLIRWELRRTLEGDLADPLGLGPRNPWGRFGACCSRGAGEMPLTLTPETSGILLMPSQSIRHVSEYSMAWMSPY